MTTAPTPPRSAGETTSVAGLTVVLHHGDVAREYGALRAGAALFDRSHRQRMRFTGPRAAELVTGLVTNDVAGLAPGQGCYAAALTPKGKTVADMRILAGEGSLLVDVPPRAAAGWTEMVRKYVNPRVAPYHDETLALQTLGVYGPEARRVVADVTGREEGELAALAPHAHAAAPLGDEAVVVARSPDLGLEGYDLFVPADARDRLHEALVRQGATPAGLAAWEIARIEAGRPEWGLDIDETTIPQEANLDDLHAISYTKGCYVGQETVARVHFRGHVNRHLRGVRFQADEPLPFRAELVDDTGKPVGDLRSSAVSPRLGGVALAMVRREVVLPAEISARWEGGTSRVQVVALPFPL